MLNSPPLPGGKEAADGVVEADGEPPAAFDDNLAVALIYPGVQKYDIWLPQGICTSMFDGTPENTESPNCGATLAMEVMLEMLSQPWKA